MICAVRVMGLSLRSEGLRVRRLMSLEAVFVKRGSALQSSSKL